MSRRLLTFHSNIDRLAAGGRTYLWTFTLADAVDYAALRTAWNRLLTYLRRDSSLWAGVRVYEVHPGRWGEFSHGLHVHVVTNRYHHVDQVRRVAMAAGWGRIHVTRVRKGREYYVTKYLTKERPVALKGWRLTALFGFTERTRLADVVVESVRASLMRLVHRWYRLSRWDVKQSIVAAWYHRYLSGRFSIGVECALRGQWRFQPRGFNVARWVSQEGEAPRQLSFLGGGLREPVLAGFGAVHPLWSAWGGVDAHSKNLPAYLRGTVGPSVVGAGCNN